MHESKTQAYIYLFFFDLEQRIACKAVERHFAHESRTQYRISGGPAMSATGRFLPARRESLDRQLSRVKRASEI